MVDRRIPPDYFRGSEEYPPKDRRILAWLGEAGWFTIQYDPAMKEPHNWRVGFDRIDCCDWIMEVQILAWSDLPDKPLLY